MAIFKSPSAFSAEAAAVSAVFSFVSAVLLFPPHPVINAADTATPATIPNNFFINLFLLFFVFAKHICKTLRIRWSADSFFRYNSGDQRVIGYIKCRIITFDTLRCHRFFIKFAFDLFRTSKFDLDIIASCTVKIDG